MERPCIATFTARTSSFPPHVPRRTMSLIVRKVPLPRSRRTCSHDVNVARIVPPHVRSRASISRVVGDLVPLLSSRAYVVEQLAPRKRESRSIIVQRRVPRRASTLPHRRRSPSLFVPVHPRPSVINVRPRVRLCTSGFSNRGHSH